MNYHRRLVPRLFLGGIYCMATHAVAHSIYNNRNKLFLLGRRIQPPSVHSSHKSKHCRLFSFRPDSGRGTGIGKLGPGVPGYGRGTIRGIGSGIGTAVCAVRWSPSLESRINSLAAHLTLPKAGSPCDRCGSSAYDRDLFRSASDVLRSKYSRLRNRARGSVLEIGI